MGAMVGLGNEACGADGTRSEPGFSLRRVVWGSVKRRRPDRAPSPIRFLQAFAWQQDSWGAPPSNACPQLSRTPAAMEELAGQ
jgi:hypothetical protein